MEIQDILGKITYNCQVVVYDYENKKELINGECNRIKFPIVDYGWEVKRIAPIWHKKEIVIYVKMVD